MQPDINSYLRAVRREIAKMADSDDPHASQILGCANEITAQIIVRETRSSAPVDRYEAAIRLIFAQLQTSHPAALPPPIWGDGAAPPSPVERFDRLSTYAEQLGAAVPDLTVLARLADVEQAFRQDWRAATDAVLSTLAGDTQDTEELPDFASLAGHLQPYFPGRETLRVTMMKPVAGMHAKEVYFVDVEDAEGKREELVLRRDRPIDLTRTSVVDEYPVMKALHTRGFPLPEPISAARTPAGLARPVMTMRKVGGQEKNLRDIANPARLLKEIAGLLASLHQMPVEGLGLSSGVTGTNASEHWRSAIERQYEWWHSVRIEPSSVVGWARVWLLDHIALAGDTLGLVHGDFSLRNLLIDSNENVSSVLDWELTHLGHPAEDLGYFRADVEGVMKWGDFMAMYEAAGGQPVSEDQLRYFEVWIHYRNAAFNATNQNLFVGGETKDIFLGTAALTLYQQAVLSKLWNALNAGI